MEIKRNFDEFQKNMEYWAKEKGEAKIGDELGIRTIVDLSKYDTNHFMSLEIHNNGSSLESVKLETWEEVKFIHDFLHGLLEKFS
jgi:hypothetical protein